MSGQEQEGEGEEAARGRGGGGAAGPYAGSSKAAYAVDGSAAPAYSVRGRETRKQWLELSARSSCCTVLPGTYPATGPPGSGPPAHRRRSSRPGRIRDSRGVVWRGQKATEISTTNGGHMSESSAAQAVSAAYPGDDGEEGEGNGRLGGVLVLGLRLALVVGLAPLWLEVGGGGVMAGKRRQRIGARTTHSVGGPAEGDEPQQRPQRRQGKVAVRQVLLGGFAGRPG